jgi:hypothetical protein
MDYGYGFLVFPALYTKLIEGILKFSFLITILIGVYIISFQFQLTYIHQIVKFTKSCYFSSFSIFNNLTGMKLSKRYIRNKKGVIFTLINKGKLYYILVQIHQIMLFSFIYRSKYSQRHICIF